MNELTSQHLNFLITKTCSVQTGLGVSFAANEKKVNVLPNGLESEDVSLC